MRKLLVASTNDGKIKEIREQLKDFNFEIVALKKFPQLQDIKEDGDSFKENALKKARVSAKETGLLTLADDSGLEVDALDGRPGIYSARYSGKNASDEKNNKKLLEELKDIPKNKRCARFRCVMAIYDPENNYNATVNGKCEGRILESQQGKNGFGYDPLFYVNSEKKAMAELSADKKNEISHRAVALNKMKKLLKKRYN